MSCNPIWTTYANSNVNGGSSSSAGTSVSVCQSVCAAQASCTGCDWDGNQNVCYIITTSAAGQIRNGLANGVTHYDLNRNCEYTPCVLCVIKRSNSTADAGLRSGGSSAESCSAVDQLKTLSIRIQLRAKMNFCRALAFRIIFSVK